MTRYELSTATYGKGCLVESPTGKYVLAADVDQMREEASQILREIVQDYESTEDTLMRRMRNVYRYTIPGIVRLVFDARDFDALTVECNALKAERDKIQSHLEAQQRETYQAVEREHAVKKELIAWKHTAKSQDALDEEMDALEQELKYAKALLMLAYEPVLRAYNTVNRTPLYIEIAKFVERGHLTNVITDAGLDDARALIEKGAP